MGRACSAVRSCWFVSPSSTPVPTALHLAFKALRLHKRPHGSQATPTQVLLQLCGVTSNALQTCVTDVVQDHSDSVENELHQVLGLGSGPLHWHT